MAKSFIVLSRTSDSSRKVVSCYHLWKNSYHFIVMYFRKFYSFWNAAVIFLVNGIMKQVVNFLTSLNLCWHGIYISISPPYFVFKEKVCNHTILWKWNYFLLRSESLKMFEEVKNTGVVLYSFMQWTNICLKLSFNQWHCNNFKRCTISASTENR